MNKGSSSTISVTNGIVPVAVIDYQFPIILAPTRIKQGTHIVSEKEAMWLQHPERRRWTLRRKYNSERYGRSLRRSVWDTRRLMSSCKMLSGVPPTGLREAQRMLLLHQSPCFHDTTGIDACSVASQPQRKTYGSVNNAQARRENLFASTALHTTTTASGPTNVFAKQRRCSNGVGNSCMGEKISSLSTVRTNGCALMSKLSSQM